MKNAFGRQGRILYIDLSNGKHWVEPIDRYLNHSIGGKGLNQDILFSEIPNGTTPFDEENRVIFGTGPLTGTLAPSSSRTTISSMNVFNKGVAEANVGGHFGPELKFADYDHVVIQGKANRPVYIWINDDDIELCDASEVWGKSTWNAEEKIKEDKRTNDLHTALIGQAGENLVRGSAVIIDRGRAAARGGIGAVMGSKNLKGIAVRGSKPVRVANPDAFLKYVRIALSKIAKSPKQKILHKGGTHLDGGFGANEAGLISTKNAQDAYWQTDRLSKVAYEVYKEKYEKRRLACFACPTYCSHIYELKKENDNSLQIEAFQANLIWGFGGRLDLVDPEKLIIIHSLLSQCGLDNDFVAAVIGWAMEIYSEGLISKKDLDGVDLGWGNCDSVIQLIHKIAKREGVGDVLAEGIMRASTELCEETKKFANTHIKGQDNIDEIRTSIAWGFGVAVSLKSGGHTEGSSTVDFDDTNTEMAKEFFEVKNLDPQVYEEKEKIVVWFEYFKQLIDSLGICYFTTQFFGFGTRLDLDIIKDLVNSAVGSEYSEDMLMNYGRKAHNIQKAFNTIHAGFSRHDDLHPQRYVDQPVKTGPHKGNRILLDKWNDLLDRYYELHGWDKETSWPMRDILCTLGLDHVVQRLEQVNRLGGKK